MATSTAKCHDLKCWLPFFGDVLDGRKNFEVRKDDRGYRVGDLLSLSEYDPERDRYTGRAIMAQVTYILRDGEAFGLQPGYVVMGIEVE